MFFFRNTFFLTGSKEKISNICFLFQLIAINLVLFNWNSLVFYFSLKSFYSFYFRFICFIQQFEQYCMLLLLIIYNHCFSKFFLFHFIYYFFLVLCSFLLNTNTKQPIRQNQVLF